MASTATSTGVGLHSGPGDVTTAPNEYSVAVSDGGSGARIVSFTRGGVMLFQMKFASAQVAQLITDLS